MKQGVHPPYGEVAFRDRATGDLVVVRSTLVARLDPTHTVDVDGRPVPVLDVDVSRYSHPFWTGKGRVVDSEGRVEAFERRYGAAAGRRPSRGGAS